MGHSGLILTLSIAAHASLPSPRLLLVGAGVRLLLHWGCYHWAHNLWVLIIYLFFLPVCCPLRFQGSPKTRQWECFLVFGNFSLFKTPFPGQSSILTSYISFFLSFILFPTSFRRQWAAFLGSWCPLLAFRSCFVEFTQCLNVLLINSWGRKWSPHPIPQPS